MRRRSVLLATTTFLALLMALAPLVGVAATERPAGNTPNTSVAPGQQLSAVVDVGKAELDSEVEERAFGLAVARADSEAAKASVIKQKMDAVERDMKRLESRFSRLNSARANESLSAGDFEARATGLTAEIGGTSRLANATVNASAKLPTDVLTANQIDVTAIERIRQRANELTGGEIAQIAQQISGHDIRISQGPPGDVINRSESSGGPLGFTTGSTVRNESVSE